MLRRSGPKVMRPLDWSFPPQAVQRELLHVPAATEEDRPPLLFVHGMNHGAWCFREHWMPAAAERGWPSYAVSLRGHGRSGGHDELRRWKLRDYEHDVMQAIIALPRPPVLVGHSMGAQVVRRVLERYVAPAAVLLTPPGGVAGWMVAAGFARRRPRAVAAAAMLQPVVLRVDELFGPEMDAGSARAYHARMTPEAPLSQLELLVRPLPRRASSPVLVIGAGEDRIVPVAEVVRTARIYGTRPHVFRGMGHDLMLEPRWQQPLDFLLEWLDTTLRPPSAA